MRTKRIAKILSLGLAGALAFSLGAGVIGTPVRAGVQEWDTITTPSWEDNVILPGSDLRDMTIGGENGDIIYVIASLGCGRDTDFCDDPGEHLWDYGLFKSDDGGVTWSDITENVYTASALPPCGDNDFDQLRWVAVAPDDPDWVAVVGRAANDKGPAPDDYRPYWVVASDDGGDNFTFAGEPMDPATGTYLRLSRDIAVSPEVDGIHNIAVAGQAVDSSDNRHGAIFRLEAGTWLSASWEDTAFYDGWDDIPAGGPDGDPPSTGINSRNVIAVDFSPNFDIDDTVVCMTAAGGTGASGRFPYIQQGTWGSDNSWNTEAGFTDAILIENDGEELRTGIDRRSMGFALPMDYDGTDSGSRAIYCYVNVYNTVTYLTGGFLFRVDDGSVSESYGPSGEPLLASIDFYGDADTGKMIVGEFVQWENDPDSPPGYAIDSTDQGLEYCAGVRVWHTAELDPCCPDWELACKNPSGLFMAVVGYTPDGEKAYAITGSSDQYEGHNLEFDPLLTQGGAGDETAFSVSLDDGVSFNQIGLIDTNIDWLSDIAVCPDCSVIYLASGNGDHPSECDPNRPLDWDDCGCIDLDWVNCSDWYSGCDSVWRSYDNGDTWERIFHGEWTHEPGIGVILRLPCDDTEDCCTLYLGVQFTDELYYTRDCGQCWTQAPGTKIPIRDFAVAAENEVMVIDSDGNFSMSTQFGRRWSDEVDTEVGSGHVVESCCLDDLVVVAGVADGPVAFSEDMGETWDLTDDLPGSSDGYAHVTCDPNCSGTIYAATSSEGCREGGIYRTTIDDGEWTDLEAEPLNYYGIVVARTGGALYAPYYQSCVRVLFLDGDSDCYTGSENCTGVARNLDPCETACCGEEDWDYLEAGLKGWGEISGCEEYFDSKPRALKICGCLSMDTPSILWAIDSAPYDVIDGSDGTVWSYEDCTAKQAPELLSPMCGEDIAADDCYDCDNADINLCWTKICDACTYDIEIATDEDFTQTVYQYYWYDGEDMECFAPADCADPCYLIPAGSLQAGTTYYWHVRVHGSETGENARSQWSETCSFNIMSGVGVSLLAPKNGSMGIGVEGVGFSWTSVGGATSYSFVLSENSDLSGALASEELSGTAYTYTGMLDYSTPYFWQVTAWKNGGELATSDVGSFTTAGEPPPPPPEPEPAQPPPDIVIPPAEQITPNWIIAVIAVGAALAVLVIVLIVRSRRP